MTEAELARELEEIIQTHPEDRAERLEAVTQASRGPTWSRARFAHALHEFEQVQFVRARELARSVVSAPPELEDHVARTRAAILVHSATEMLQEPTDIAATTAATRMALAARLPYDAGIGFQLLAHAYYGNDRAALIASYDAAVRCYLEAGSAAAPCDGLLRLARMAVEDGDRARALRLVELGLGHAKKFWPFATRGPRPALEKLRDELSAQ